MDMAQEIQQVSAPSVEERLTALESQVAFLKSQIDQGRKGWMERFIGSTSDMPDFDEVVRYGREARLAQRPPDEVPG